MNRIRLNRTVLLKTIVTIVKTVQKISNLIFFILNNNYLYLTIICGPFYKQINETLDKLYCYPIR